MPRGSKAKYTDNQMVATLENTYRTQPQKRQAEDIAEGYEERGTSEERAKAIGWATVNKEYGGGAKGGSGSRTIQDKTPSIKGGKKGGQAAASRPKAERSASARKAARTRKQNENKK